MHRIFEINAGKEILKPFTDPVVFLACVCVCKEYCLRNDVTSALKKASIQFFQLAGFLYMMIDLCTIRENEVTVYHAKT